MPQRFALTSDGDEQAVGFHTRQMTFFDRDVSYELVRLSDESFVNLGTVQPRNRAGSFSRD